MSELVPKIKFSEFSHKWKHYKLCELSEIRSASRVHKEQWTESGVPFFRTSDVVSAYKGKENNKAFISIDLFKELSNKSGQIKKNDLLVTGGGSIGVPYLVPNNEPLYFKDADLLWFKNKEIVNGFYLYTFFLTPQFRSHLRRISHTGTISHYTIEQAKSTPINLPSLIEQQKIASFLTSVDSKISQLKEKHRLLKEYKKGVMQQVFSQQLHFKDEDGKAYPEWVTQSLREVGCFSGGGTPSTDNDSFWGGDIPWISSSDIQEDKLFNINVHRYITKAAIKNSATKIIPKNSLLIVSRVGVGKFAACRHEICTSQDFTNFTPITCDLDFMAYLLYSNRRKLISLGQGTTIKGFTVADLSTLSVRIPCHNEQQKIAQFLQSIDKKIDTVAQQVEQTKQFKKGLLQQMFV